MAENCKVGEELIIADCKDIAVSGNTGRFWTIDQAWWNAAVGGAGVTLGTDGEITGIDLTAALTGARSYRVETFTGSIITGQSLTDNPNGQSGFSHLVTAVVPTLAMKMKNSNDAGINFGRVVLIVETNAPKGAVVDSNSPPYILYGKDSGLKVTVNDNNLGDQATGNSQTVTFSTPTAGVQLEKNQPINVAMTTAAIELLETPIV